MSIMTIKGCHDVLTGRLSLLEVPSTNLSGTTRAIIVVNVEIFVFFPGILAFLHIMSLIYPTVRSTLLRSFHILIHSFIHSFTVILDVIHG